MCKTCFTTKSNNLKTKKGKQVYINGNASLYCVICDCEHFVNKTEFESTFNLVNDPCQKCVIF